MHWNLRHGVAVLALGGSAALAYVPPNGYTKTGASFPGSAMAISADGKIAVAWDSISGGASIRIYPSLADVGGTALASFSDPTWKFIAGMEFTGPDAVVFGENGDRDTVFRADISSGNVRPLAPDRACDGVADLAVRGPYVYATTAGGPGKNDLIRIAWDEGIGGAGPVTVIDDFGTGYAGGVAIDESGNFVLTDSNGFSVAGLLRRFDALFSPFVPIDLAPGGGTGAVDLVFDAEGDLIVSTGATLSRVSMGDGSVRPFGTFTDPWAFPTYLAFGPDGPGSTREVLLVSGFTEEGGIFAITRVPEPCTAIVVSAAAIVLMGRGRKERAR